MSPPDPLKTAFLLTGRPGTGKTTIIRKVLARLPGQAGGFYTEEVREAGQRVGFCLVTLGGERATLAHVSLRSPYRVAKYGVDLEALERVGVRALREASRSCNYVVVDEIGKMELFSAAFREEVLEAVEGGKVVLGTIMSASHPWADIIKDHPAVLLLPVSEGNRETLPATILDAVQSLRASKQP